MLEIAGVPCAARESVPALACRVFGRRLLELDIEPGRGPAGARAVPFAVYRERLRAAGHEHVTVRIDLEIEDVRAALEARLGPPVVIMERYVFTPRIMTLRPLKRLGRPRSYEPGDLDAVLGLARSSFRFTRFYRDKLFRAADADRLYEEIGRSFCEDRASGHVLVTERRGAVVGFLACRSRLEARDGALVRIRGGGLGAVAPGHAGCYPGLVHAAIEAWSPDVDVAEFVSQTDNRAAARIWRFFGLRLAGRTAVYRFEP